MLATSFTRPWYFSEYLGPLSDWQDQKKRIRYRQASLRVSLDHWLNFLPRSCVFILPSEFSLPVLRPGTSESKSLRNPSGFLASGSLDSLSVCPVTRSSMDRDDPSAAVASSSSYRVPGSPENGPYGTRRSLFS